MAPGPPRAPPRSRIPPRAARLPTDHPLHPTPRAAPGTGNPTWGYRRIHGELLVLGIEVAAATVWQVLKDAGIDPAAERTSTTWSAVLRSQAGVLPACDFFMDPEDEGTPARVLIRDRDGKFPALREYERSYDSHRPHQGIANARPLHAPPQPIVDQAGATPLDIRRRQRSGGILDEDHRAA